MRSETFEVPDEYAAACEVERGTASAEDVRLCGLVVMLDEAVGETMCKLREAGMIENTLTILANDNGAGPRHSNSNSKLLV